MNKGRLEFIEPDEQGKVHNLEVTFEPKELEQTRLLAEALWRHVHNLHFPDASDYQPNLTGIKAFVSDLIDGKI